MAATRRKDEEFGTSQLGIDPGTQASTPVDETAITPQETMLAQREARMAAQPQRMPQPMGATGVNRPPAVSMGAVRGQEPGTRTNALGQTFDQSGRMTSMPSTGRWGTQTAADVAPQPTMQGGEFAMARGARAPIQGMQGTTPASERIESQKNVYERMQAGDERARAQFEALPPDAQRAQIARAEANRMNVGAGQQVVNPQLEAQRAFNQRPEDQPQYQPGQVIGSGTYGAVVVGARGAQMPFVQDPMNPNAGAIPVSANMSREEYVANTTPQQRQAARRMIMERGGAEADELQKIENAREQMRVSGTMRNRDNTPRAYVGPEEQKLQRLEDDLIYGAMRNPDALIASRQRTAEERQRQTAAEQRASQVERERAMKEEQKFYSGIWKQAESEARTELEGGEYGKAPTEAEIMARANKKFQDATGMSVSQVGIGAGPGAGMAMPMVPGQAPVQSGAPDSRQREIYVDPESPVQFEMTPQGNLAVRLPNGEIIAGYDMEGEAVAFPKSPAEEAMLPPGTKFVTPGSVRRNQPKIKVKPGETGGPSAAAQVAPFEEQSRIAEAATKRAGERFKPIAAYREQKDEYDRLRSDAAQMAVEAFNRRYNTNLQIDASGKPNLKDPNVQRKFERGTSVMQEALAIINPADSFSESQRRTQLDETAAWENELNKATLALAQERYQDGKIPEWVDRTGTQITGVSQPKPPAGYREEMKPGEVTPEDVVGAEEEYYRGLGTTREAVQSERLVAEARSAYRAPIIKNGQMMISYKGQQIPAIRMQAGGASAVLPIPTTAEQAVTLMREGKPFAIDRDGMPAPYKFDRSDPLLQQVFSESSPREISAQLGAGQRNPGAVAAKEWAFRTFGYLPMNVRESIVRSLLADAGYRLTG